MRVPFRSGFIRIGVMLSKGSADVRIKSRWGIVPNNMGWPEVGGASSYSNTLCKRYLLSNEYETRILTNALTTLRVHHLTLGCMREFGNSTREAAVCEVNAQQQGNPNPDKGSHNRRW